MVSHYKPDSKIEYVVDKKSKKFCKTFKIPSIAGKIMATLFWYTEDICFRVSDVNNKGKTVTVTLIIY